MRKTCHSGRAMLCIARSGIQKYRTIPITSGSRLAPRFTGLGRDDELRHSLKGRGFPRHNKKEGSMILAQLSVYPISEGTSLSRFVRRG